MFGTRPQTEAERALVAAAIAVYRERRAAGALPADAWTRVTDLTDDVLVAAVQHAEVRLGLRARPTLTGRAFG